MNEALDPADFRRKEAEKEIKQINRRKVVFGINEKEKSKLEKLQKRQEQGSNETKPKRDKRVMLLTLKQLNLLK